MSRNERTLFWICVIFTLAVALLAVALALPRTSAFSFDYQGVFVAIFAALVALLIGWQIFNSIDLTKKMEQANASMEAATAKVNELESRISAEFENLKEMNFGIYCINSAAMSYLQHRINEKRQDYASLASAYLLALHGIGHILRSGIVTDESRRMFRLGNAILTKVMNKLDGDLSEYKEAITTEFDDETHKKADNYFYEIVENKDLLDAKIWEDIEYNQQRRARLRVACAR